MYVLLHVTSIILWTNDTAISYNIFHHTNSVMFFFLTRFKNISPDISFEWQYKPFYRQDRYFKRQSTLTTGFQLWVISYLIKKIWSIKRGFEQNTVWYVEYFLDILDDIFSGCCCETQDRYPWKLSLHNSQELVIWGEKRHQPCRSASGLRHIYM